MTYCLRSGALSTGNEKLCVREVFASFDFLGRTQIVVDEKNRVWFCERTMTSVNDPTDRWKKNTFRFDTGDYSLSNVPFDIIIDFSLAA